MDGESLTARHLASAPSRLTASQVETSEARSPGPSSTVRVGRPVAINHDTNGEDLCPVGSTGRTGSTWRISSSKPTPG